MLKKYDPLRALAAADLVLLLAAAICCFYAWYLAAAIFLFFGAYTGGFLLGAEWERSHWHAYPSTHWRYDDHE